MSPGEGRGGKRKGKEKGAEVQRNRDECVFVLFKTLTHCRVDIVECEKNAHSHKKPTNTQVTWSSECEVKHTHYCTYVALVCVGRL